MRDGHESDAGMLPDSSELLCEVCQRAGSFEPWLEVSLGHVFDRWIQRCGSCGFHQVRPRLTPAEIAQLYPPAYFDTDSDIGYVDYAREAQRRRREAYFLARRYRRVANHQGGDHTPRALDVGCALGFLLTALRDEGFEVAGVDASAFAAYYAETRFGIAVTNGTLEHAAFPDNQFDFVIQKDVLEHVAAPRAHLEETRRVMRDGGQLWVVTPNGQANLRPLAAISAGPADELPLLDQGHLSFFSLQNLHQLFGECGFVVERARAIGVRRGMRALGWLPGQHRFAERGRRVGTAGPAAAGPGEGSAFAPLADAVDRATERHVRWIQSRKGYFYLHRFSKYLDSLPAFTRVGYDFEFWLRKR